LCTKSAKQATNEELQGTVATYARWGGIFDIHLTTNLPKNLLVIFLNRLRFDRIMVMSLWPAFLAQLAFTI